MHLTMELRVSGEVKPDFSAMVSRSRTVANGMSKGVQFLFRKNNIEHLAGSGRLAGNNSVEVTDSEGNKKKLYCKKYNSGYWCQIERAAKS